jgi:hypothetical protein
VKASNPTLLLGRSLQGGGDNTGHAMQMREIKMQQNFGCEARQRPFGTPRHISG